MHRWKTEKPWPSPGLFLDEHRVPWSSRLQQAKACMRWLPPRIRSHASTWSPRRRPTTVVSGLADRTTAHVDALGRRLVIAVLRVHQLADFSRHMHENEHRCGGYFFFDTRAEPERFVRGQSSVHGITGQVLPSYTIDNQAVMNRWICHVREANIRNTITHLWTAYPNRCFASNHGRNAGLWIREHWRGVRRRVARCRATDRGAAASLAPFARQAASKRFASTFLRTFSGSQMRPFIAM
jgi:hypothetical protein